MFSKVNSGGKKELFGANVERLDPLEVVKKPDGSTVGKNLRLDFDSGEVWMLVGHLDNQGEQETLPQSGKSAAKVVDKLSVVEDGATFQVDESCTANEAMHGVYSIWRAPSGFLIQLVRNVGFAAPAAPTATLVKKR